ncbi:Uncharacterised protein [Acinetobacter johnsonii]|nr:Uncharacterised protein [Acinetobacter johnsonii]
MYKLINYLKCVKKSSNSHYQNILKKDEKSLKKQKKGLFFNLLYQ